MSYIYIKKCMFCAVFVVNEIENVEEQRQRHR